MQNHTKRILVFPCGSEIGLEINRSLRWCETIDLYGGSSVESNHGKFVYEKYIGNLPFVDKENFLVSLNTIIKKHNIDFVFPALDDVMLALIKNHKVIRCKIIGSPYETCKICRSKKLTYEYFHDKIKTPKVYESIKECSTYPVFMKPESGQGSKRTFLVYDKKDVIFYKSKIPELFISEYLSGKEYTIDCFTDRRGEMLFSGARERVRIMNGISVDTKPLNRPDFLKVAQTINESLKFRGAWHFQLKENERGEPVLLEIAPRIAGSMSLYRNLGINFALLSVLDALDMDVKIIQNQFKLELDRALSNKFKHELVYKHVYINLAGCLIVKNEVNPQAVAFLCQCINKGIKLHLLAEKLNMRDLQNLRLTGLFDEIIEITKATEKVDRIKHEKSIFIDDDLETRDAVFRKKNIPVFSTDAIECLIK